MGGGGKKHAQKHFSINTLAGRLIVIDAAQMEWRELKLGKDPACPVCGAGTAGTGRAGG